MEVSGSVALVTGSSGGVGTEFVRQLIARGAAKVYAVSRSGQAPDLPQVVGIKLDITDSAAVENAGSQLRDVQLLVNNAGIATGESLVSGDLNEIRREFETNVFGGLSLAQAFAEHLKNNGGGAVLNVLSAASWFSAPGATSYAASKAAAWSATDGLRMELASRGTQVLGLHMAVVDAGMGAALEGEKTSVADVVSQALDGLESGATEVIVDDLTRQVKAGLSAVPAERYAGLI